MTDQKSRDERIEEAAAKANSHDPDGGCRCDFDRVKSIG